MKQNCSSMTQNWSFGVPKLVVVLKLQSRKKQRPILRSSRKTKTYFWV